FNTTAREVAHAWRKQIAKFRDFAALPGVRARMVRYEAISADPEPTLREIVAFLGVPWHDDLLNYYKLDLTLYRNPRGHLSAQQVNKPINTDSIGRWRRDLTPGEVQDFEAEAGDLLQELGYAA